MKRILWSLLITGTVLLFWECREKGPHLKDTILYVADLEPNEVPVRAQTKASGRAALEYTRSTHQLSFNLSLRAIEPLKVVIAYGDPHSWDTGPEIVDLTSQISGTGGTGTIVLTDDEHGKLLMNSCYFRIDTQEYPHGELRGQILLAKEN